MLEALKPGEPVNKGVKRVVRGRIDKALEALQHKEPSDSAVHDARKQLKVIRGILRLVSDELDRSVFRRENRTYRDAARPLSEVRDGKVLIDSVDALIEAYPGRLRHEDASGLRSELRKRRRDKREAVFRHDRVGTSARRRLRRARKRIRKWPLRSKGWSAIEGGLRATYKRCRRAMREVHREVTDQTLHEWRKRAKDVRYQLDFLQNVCPDIFESMARQTHRLADLLGDDHDLSVLRRVLARRLSGDVADNERLITLIDERRGVLQRQAISLGDQLFTEPPRVYVSRLRDHWKMGRAIAN